MPPSPSAQSKAGSDDSTSRLSEAALRKKKNADAQAAFRARRANYIATLEETVTNLESVVIQLQDSCREARQEASELRSENSRLKQEAKQRERLIKRLTWQGKGAVDQSPDSQPDDFPPTPPYHMHTSSSAVAPMNSGHVGPYGDNSLRYSTGSDQPSLAGTSYHPGNGQDFPQRSPALPFVGGVDADASSDCRSQQMESHRLTRYDQYAYSMDGSSRDATWAHTAGTSTSEVPDSGSSSHSPSYIESPSLTSSELSYASRFPVLDEQKVPLASLNTSSYMFPSSRSLSPAVSTPTSTSSTSLAPATFPFTFPEGSVVQDRPEFSYRRHHPGPELMLHGGTADIPVAASGGDAVRYRLGSRMNAADRPIAQALSSYSRLENSSGGRDSDESESPSYTYSTRSRRSTVTSPRVSRSPSPRPPPICSTLAVIKAQAFGALRRTRSRSKKSSEGAAKAAVEALEARGIGLGIGVGTASKRPRLHNDDDDMHESTF
ncbi:hypothetical protein AcW1_000599 [Taiwanofungus camphoratus]|nr:hypothetical protein AcV7_000618 [Antrodia cinnamomea]KAI0963554.1 hypothetical protein AcW1_000599 [Antrodia cinnamomea]